MRTFLFISLFALAAPLRGETPLITSIGKHASKDGTLVIEVVVPDRNHLKFRVDWTVKRAGEVGGRVISTSSPGRDEETYTVEPGRWAFCFVGNDEVWFFDGKAGFSRYKGTTERLTLFRGDPTLAERAPDGLKKWAGSKSRARR